MPPTSFFCTGCFGVGSLLPASLDRNLDAPLPVSNLVHGCHRKLRGLVLAFARVHVADGNSLASVPVKLTNYEHNRRSV